MDTPAKFFVGGLAPDTTEDHLRQHFEQFGELCDVAVMKDQYGVPRCFGFVQFADASAHSCRPIEEHVILDKKVDVKAAVPKEAIDQGAPIRTNKIFVGGLSKSTNEDGVRSHFSQLGAVNEVLMKFTEAGESRGFCFVEFDSEDVAEQICKAQGQIIDGKEVECKLARPLGDKSLTKGKGKGKGFGKGDYGKGDYGKGGYGKGDYGKGDYSGYGKGKGGPIRNDYFNSGKGAARASPYGGAPVRNSGGMGGGGKGYDGGYGSGYGASTGSSSYGPSGYGKGAGYPKGGYGASGKGSGALVPYQGEEAYEGGSSYGAPSSYASGYGSSYAASGGYSSGSGYGSAASGGYSGGYSGYSAAPASASYGGSYGGYGGY
uniref:RRM domain-containing protein n=2 Tax=Eutreptiella gymnastica TaxID=73025 RepID=A0A7S4D1I8_9EUGL